VPDSSCYYSAGCNVGDIYTLPNECFSWVIEVDPFCCDNEWDNACDDLYVYCQVGWTGPVSITERINDLIIYPNPTSDYINVSKKVDVEVYNSIGSLVLKQNKSTLVDLSTFKSGIYHLRVILNNRITNFKIIKN
jgi:hypothetical protein